MLSKVSRPLSSALRAFSAEKFKIVEVGPRDGLQNEKTLIPTDVKVTLIDKLSSCGLPVVEVTSFVSPKWVPQMGDHLEVIRRICKAPNVSYPVLVPNLKGLQSALETGAVSEIALFVAASEGFSRKNINCSIEESVQRAAVVAKEALAKGLKVRGYLSTVIGCPYDGSTDPRKVAALVEKLLTIGCYEISLGDTIGVGSAGTVNKLFDALLPAVPVTLLAAHFHDTYGQALSNVLVAIERGVRVADASVAGLGGCPYAKGATGNLATEDLVYLLHGLGFHTGVDLDRLIETSAWICQTMGRANASRVATAYLNKTKP